jgi:RIO kinase 1
VIIDLPQAVNAASNNNAFTMLQRDVQNITETLGRFAPELLTTQYAPEMWALYELGELKPETQLTGVFVKDETAANVGEVMLAIDEAREEAFRREEMRQDALAGGGD